MSSTLVRMAVRRSLGHVRHVDVVEPRAATGLTGDVYARLEREFGVLAPPVALHSADPSLLAASWLLLRETLMATGEVDRAGKEAVAAAVSSANSCPYCVEVHTAALGALDHQPDAAALAAARIADVTDPQLRELSRWAAATGGDVVGPVLPASPARAAELLGVVLTFQYLNRMVNVFLGESPLPAGLPAAMRGFVRDTLGRMVLPAAGTDLAPGGALALLPPAALPEELAWARGRETVAQAVARAAAAIEAAGERAVPASVRECVRDALATWSGDHPGLGRDWLEPAVSRVPPSDRPAARLALLTALAAYRVDATVVADFRRANPVDRVADGDVTSGDVALLGLTAWASFTAASVLTARRRWAEPDASGNDNGIIVFQEDAIGAGSPRTGERTQR